MARARVAPPADRPSPVAVVPAVVFGPDPTGAAVADSVQALYGAELAGTLQTPGNIRLPVSGLGSPMSTSYADLGPIQGGPGGFTRLRSSAGVGTVRIEDQPAFPSANGLTGSDDEPDGTLA